jgi:2-polyprenyl-6-methoxyphenol hydroxylase-like FAD-dependent oxidoreductase
MQSAELRETEIAIVGGGLAGSVAAAMLARQGRDVVLIDLHETYPPDFRCEKIDEFQMPALERTGLSDVLARASTPIDTILVTRAGFGPYASPRRQYGFRYEAMVAAFRATSSAQFVQGKVASLAASEDRQIVELADGAKISARLVVLATGLNNALRHSLGIARETLSANHSISIGFDLHPVGRPAFAFPALTYHYQSPKDRACYLALFPIGNAMRANLFVYRDPKDPWFAQFRADPKTMLLQMSHGLGALLGDFEIRGPVGIRPIDLQVTQNIRQPGVVLVGDAFSTSCPAAGTGAEKSLIDVGRLCNVYIPQWLATPGMAADKIAAYYADPVKSANDERCLAKAFRLRASATDPALRWAARRWARFAIHMTYAILRGLAQRLSAKTPEAEPRGTHPSSKTASSTSP